MLVTLLSNIEKMMLSMVTNAYQTFSQLTPSSICYIYKTINFK
jgi:hypothetical protein